MPQRINYAPIFKTYQATLMDNPCCRGFFMCGANCNMGMGEHVKNSKRVKPRIKRKMGKKGY
jgi:hypothetical protein